MDSSALGDERRGTSCTSGCTRQVALSQSTVECSQMPVTVRVIPPVFDALVVELYLLWNRIPAGIRETVEDRYPTLSLRKMLAEAQPFMGRLSTGAAVPIECAGSEAFFRLIGAVGHRGIAPMMRVVFLRHRDREAFDEYFERHQTVLLDLFETISIAGIGYFDNTDPDGVLIRPHWLLLRSEKAAFWYCDYIRRHGVGRFLELKQCERDGTSVEPTPEERVACNEAPGGYEVFGPMPRPGRLSRNGDVVIAEPWLASSDPGSQE